MATEVKETPTIDLNTRTILARLLKPFTRFRRFLGTPIERARVLMGPDQIHDIAEVRLYLDQPEGFLESEYLKRVPYTERELSWAARNGFVLTITCCSMKQIARHAGKEVNIVPEISGNPHIVGTSPKHPQWRLVSRLAHRSIDVKKLGLSASELKRRLQVAVAPLALTVAYLDFAIYRKTSPDGLFLTATPLGEYEGKYLRRVMIGGARRAHSTSPINVVGGYLRFMGDKREPVHYPILTLKPRRIPSV